MPNPLAARNFDFSEMQTGANSFEFSQFFSKKKLANDKVAWRVKKEALKQVDILFINLPKCGQAIKILSTTSVNKGIEINKGTGTDNEITDQDNDLIKEFKDSMLPNPVEFLSDIVRIKQTKGNLLLHLTEDSNKKLIWAVIEPERFSVVSTSENEVLAKYDIQGFLLHQKSGYQELDPNYTLFIRSSPASILGAPLLLFNNLMSKSIIAKIKKYFQIQDNGAFKKFLLRGKKMDIRAGQNIFKDLTDKEMAKLSDDIRTCQTDPTKSVQIIDVDTNLIELPVLTEDPEFTGDYDETYTMHTASITGVAPYRLLPPSSINRATAQQQYSEMIEDTIQPINNSLSNLVQRMFEMWLLHAKKQYKTDIVLTVQNPKPTLDIAISAKDLSEMEKNKQIKTNELRDRLSLEPYNDDEQVDRDEIRKQLSKQPQIINSTTETENT